MSGSENAADIAERKRLEATLYDQKRDLEDSYRDHSYNSLSEALDEEALAYEESMNNYIEGLRTTLDEATLDMTMFMEQVIVAVSTNAETVEQKYHDTGLAISEDLTDPWTAAKNAMSDYEGEAGLGLMNKWLADGQFFDKFKTDATSDLKAPWNAGKTAADAFDSKVESVMDSVLEKITSNVSTAKTELQKVYDEINKINTITIKPKVETPTSPPPTNPAPAPKPETKPTSPAQPSKDSDNVRALQNVLNTVFKAGLTEDGLYGQATKLAVGRAQKTIGDSPYDGKYDASTRSKMLSYIDRLIDLTRKEGGDTTKYKNAKYKLPTAMYAKGTMGTDRDEWAITDEPWLGDELTMYATPEGRLSYMRAGSTVVPADATREILKLADIGVNGLMAPKLNSGITLMSNAINKPEINLSFEALVKAERIDENTLPEVKRFVQQEINSLVKQMNYAIKGRGGR